MSNESDNSSSLQNKTDSFTLSEIRNILPQQFPFLFIDRVVQVDKEKQSITCAKNVSGNESYFQGHFPDNPVLPGVIIIEAMAQASILLYAVVKPANILKKPVFFLGKVESVFKKPVFPGDVLTLTARCEKIIDTGGITKVTAMVGEAIVAEATLNFGVKIKNA